VLVDLSIVPYKNCLFGPGATYSDYDIMMAAITLCPVNLWTSKCLVQ